MAGDAAEIRTITQAERAEFCALRRYAFRTWTADPPTEAEIEWVVPDDALGFFLQGRMVGGMIVHRFRQSVRGVIKPMGGVAAVASYPEFRGRGHVTRLLEHAYARMREHGRPVSMLHPFRESFYERFGYVAAGAALEIEVPTEALAYTLERKPGPGWVEERLAPAEARDAFFELLRETAPRYNGFTVHESIPGGAWEQRTRDCLYVMIRRDGTLQAAARYEKLGHPSPPLLRVRDPYWRDAAGRNALLRFLATHRDQVPAINLQVPYGSPVHTWFRDTMSPFVLKMDEKPWMVRLIDVAPALDGLPAEPAGGLTIEVTDDRCPWNNGRFALEARDGRLRATAAGDCGPRGRLDARLDQKALASLAYGCRSVDDLCALGWMERPSDRASDLLDRWFPPTSFYNTLGF